MKTPLFPFSRTGLFILALLPGLIAAAPAMANRHRGIPVQVFQPSHDSLGFLSLDSPFVLAPYSLDMFFGSNFALSPMRLEFADDVTTNDARALRFSTAFDFQATLGLTRWMQLTLHMPFFRLAPGPAFDLDKPWGFTANDPLTTMRNNTPNSVPGDPALFLKVHAFAIGGFDCGFGLNVTLPFGVEEVFAGDENVTVKPSLLLGWQGTRIGLLLNAGYLWRQEHSIDRPTDETVTMLSSGPEFHAGIGAKLKLFKKWAIMVSANKYVPLSDGETTDAPVEALAGIAWSPTPDLTVTVFGGSDAGMNEEYGRGTPLRIGAQLVWTATERTVESKVGDKDNDGINDDVDQCPDLPEDIDKFEDEDGCPEPDNDQDGLADGVDKCPNEPEDEDAYEDTDGCPDLDNDGDKVPDSQDRCPMEAGDARFDGCRIPDRDKDGIPDNRDQCPDEAGEESLAGCPDVGIRVNVADGKVLPPGKVEFVKGKADLTPESLPVLLELANQIKGSPQLRLIRIEVHVESGGREPRNLQLTNARAMAIRAFLVSKGVSPVRVQGVGYGSKFPIRPNTTPENRAANNRVDFILVHQ
ncbi:OmpA family protein [Myxococcota bacterium]|nr:OmpA family protein [Myxococcota bacterium]MBU1410555.1 OmpA family protein [Myxococcota bacterium]MBU1509176.1 OmpA family protein [Myxococcota bacterium]